MATIERSHPAEAAAVRQTARAPQRPRPVLYLATVVLQLAPAQHGRVGERVLAGMGLFAGRTYQIPLTETFFFGGLGLGVIAMLMHFRDDKGQTIVERGLDRVKVSPRRRQLIKFCAIFGVVHASFVLVYAVPQQYFATHSDRFPSGYPSYMVNGMCASGAHENVCPGPHVPMPRP